MLNKENRNRIEAGLRKVDDSARIEYERRLSIPYNDGKQSFMDQYLRGGGCELQNKFWSPISSSRLCFELYSWIANEPKVTMAFEYKLPRLCTLGTPNMDVYIETEKEVWYIESKFTENVNNRKFGEDMPEQYWKEIDDQGNALPGGGFHTTSGGYRPKPLLERFNNDETFAQAFQKFCEETNRKSVCTEPEDWFDAKQETCHILGIINEIRKRKEIIAQKKIIFANIVYSFDEPITDFAKDFIVRAKALVKELTGVEIIYKISFMQEVISKYGNRTAYGVNATVYDQIEKYFGKIF